MNPKLQKRPGQAGRSRGAVHQCHAGFPEGPDVCIQSRTGGSRAHPCVDACSNRWMRMHLRCGVLSSGAAVDRSMHPFMRSRAQAYEYVQKYKKGIECIEKFQESLMPGDMTTVTAQATSNLTSIPPTKCLSLFIEYFIVICNILMCFNPKSLNRQPQPLSIPLLHVKLLLVPKS